MPTSSESPTRRTRHAPAAATSGVAPGAMGGSTVGKRCSSVR